MELLGFGEALHGGKDILLLRNQLFQHLVERHRYSAIAIESSFPRVRVVNEYIAGCGPSSYEAAQDIGFSHGFGHLDANRELVEWMRQYNANPSHGVKLQFYGFDSPTEMTSSDSPGQVLHSLMSCLSFSFMLQGTLPCPRHSAMNCRASLPLGACFLPSQIMI